MASGDKSKLTEDARLIDLVYRDDVPAKASGEHGRLEREARSLKEVLDVWRAHAPLEDVSGAARAKVLDAAARKASRGGLLQGLAGALRFPVKHPAAGLAFCLLAASAVVVSIYTRTDERDGGGRRASAPSRFDSREIEGLLAKRQQEMARSGPAAEKAPRSAEEIVMAEKNGRFDISLEQAQARTRGLSNVGPSGFFGAVTEDEEGVVTSTLSKGKQQESGFLSGKGEPATRGGSSTTAGLSEAAKRESGRVADEKKLEIKGGDNLVDAASASPTKAGRAGRRARRLYRQGLQLQRKKLHRSAIERFKRSLRHRGVDRGAVYFAWARSEAAMGNTSKALALLARVKASNGKRAEEAGLLEAKLRRRAARRSRARKARRKKKAKKKRPPASPPSSK
jgi:hypothetical protein